MSSRADLKFMQKGRDLKKKSSKRTQIHIEKNLKTSQSDKDDSDDEDIFQNVTIDMSNDLSGKTNDNVVENVDVQLQPFSNHNIELPQMTNSNQEFAKHTTNPEFTQHTTRSGSTQHTTNPESPQKSNIIEQDNLITLSEVCCTCKNFKILCLISYRILIVGLLFMVMMSLRD